MFNEVPNNNDAMRNINIHLITMSALRFSMATIYLVILQKNQLGGYKG